MLHLKCPDDSEQNRMDRAVEATHLTTLVESYKHSLAFTALVLYEWDYTGDIFLEGMGVF